MTIDECRKRVGHGVVHVPSVGELEHGVIAFVSETHVFVKFEGERDARVIHPSWLEPISVAA